MNAIAVIGDASAGQKSKGLIRQQSLGLSFLCFTGIPSRGIFLGQTKGIAIDSAYKLSNICATWLLKNNNSKYTLLCID
jgi:hypothetical protein